MEYKQPELIELFRLATAARDAAARDLAEGRDLAVGKRYN
jgi:hypothetical protein